MRYLHAGHQYRPADRRERLFNGTTEYRDRSPTNRSGPDTRRQCVGPGDPREVSFNRYNHRFGDGESVDLNFFVNAGVDLGADFELYTFGSYGTRDANGTGFYRRSLDPCNRDFAASTTTFVPFYPDGFLPQINSDITDIAGVPGIRGSVSGWNLDLSVNYGTNRLDYTISNSFNTSLGGIASPVIFDAGGLRSGQTSVNFDAQRDIDLGIGETSIAFGDEWRNENYRIIAGELASYVAGPFALTNGAPPGAQVFPGFAPSTSVDGAMPATLTNPQARNDIRIPAGEAPGDVKLSPKWVVDLELCFNPLEAVQLAIGANNLLDEYPDRLPFGTVGGVNFGVNNEFLPYSSQSPFGFSGRFVYGRASVEF